MKKIIVILITLLGVTGFTGILFFGAVYSPNGEVSASPSAGVTSKQPSASSVTSTKLLIPNLKINAKIQDVGITMKGNVAAPTNFSDVGWYKYGPIPGQAGTAIIDGHVDNGLAFPAVFGKLKNIQPGDSIYVQTKENNLLHFIVSDINTYDYNSPTDNIFINSETPRLVLITCTGSWMPELRTHNKRLVVTATIYKQ